MPSRSAICFFVAAVAVLAAACGGPEVVRTELSSRLEATGMLLDERVRSAAAQHDAPVGRLEDVEAAFGRLASRHVVPPSFRFTYADADGDGVVDDRRVTLVDDDSAGDDPAAVCVVFSSSHAQEATITVGVCPGDQPESGPSTTPPPSDAPAQVDAPPTTVSRPKVPGFGAVTDAADATVARGSATQVARQASQLAALDGTRPDAVPVLEQLADSSGVTLHWVDGDGDGFADGGRLSVVAATGVAACVTFAPDGSFDVSDELCPR